MDITYGSYACVNSICKWPEIKLMHGNIIDVRGNRLGNVITIPLGLWSLSEMFLRSV